MDTVTSRGVTFAIALHIVWPTWQCQDLLGQKADKAIKQAIGTMVRGHPYSIPKIEIKPNAVRIRLECPPTVSIPDIVKSVKGVTARAVFRECEDLAKKLQEKRLWAPTYFVGTESNELDEQIKAFLDKSQKKGAESKT